MPIVIAPSPRTTKRYGSKLTKASLALDMTTFALASLAFLFGLSNAIQKSDNYQGPHAQLATESDDNYYPSGNFGSITAAQSTAIYIVLGIFVPICTILFSLSSIFSSCSDRSSGPKPGRSVAISVLLIAMWIVTLFWQWVWMRSGFRAWGVTAVGVSVNMAVGMTYFVAGGLCGCVEVARMAVHARVLDLEKKGRKMMVRVESPVGIEMVGDGEREGVEDVRVEFGGGKGGMEVV